MARHPGHQRQHRHRIDQAELTAASHIVGVAALVDVRQAETIGKEAGIEAGLLEQAGQVFVALGVPDIVQRRRGMAPGAGITRGRSGFQVGDQVHLALYGHGRSSSNSYAPLCT